VICEAEILMGGVTNKKPRNNNNNSKNRTLRKTTGELLKNTFVCRKQSYLITRINLIH
jgi:hypothetical protein